MVEKLSFFLPMKVGVKGNSKKIVKFGKRFSLIGDDKAREAEKTLVARLLEHRPAAPIEGPVRLAVAFVRKAPASPKWKRDAALDGEFLPVTRPDRGNALKLIEDAMSGLFYVDDAQVVEGDVSKRYGPTEGYEITLTALHQATKPEPLPRCARKGCKKRVDHKTSHYCGPAHQAADEPVESAP